MVDNISERDSKKTKKDFFNLLLEAYGFIRIAASPLFIGIAIGVGVYVSDPGTVRLIIAISIASIGLIIGIIWAIRIWRKNGTLDYITTARSPDFDKFDKD